jgi:hypothetical protein
MSHLTSKNALLCGAALFLGAVSAAAQGYTYDQPMDPNGGTLRNSQLWVDPQGQNDLDSDAIAWEDFQLPQDTTLTRLSWCGETAPPLGFQVSFFNQDPNTTAVQPDIFAAGSHPISEHIYTSFAQAPLGGGLYRFTVDLVVPLGFLANTRYFVSVVGLTPIPYATWNWAANSTGPNGTFWWMRGLHMFFHLSESRAMTLEGTVAAGCTPPAAYCTAKVNSQGCTPAIDFAGSPSFGGASAFRVTGSQFLNKKSGVLFYGLQPNGAVFEGGFLCVKMPVIRTAVQNSGGSASGTDCSGTYSYDFEALILGGTDPHLAAGAMVYTQYWARDPADPTGFTTSLSNALSFEICP